MRILSGDLGTYNVEEVKKEMLVKVVWHMQVQTKPMSQTLMKSSALRDPAKPSTLTLSSQFQPHLSYLP